jgi:SET domain-containing protein
VLADAHGVKHIALIAATSIAIGDEITYDYQFAIEAEDRKIRCLCGQEGCRKFLN